MVQNQWNEAFQKILLQTKTMTKTKTKPKKTQHVLYFRKAGALRISNMMLRGGVATKSESQ